MNSKAFTLIELLVVISVIGLLSSIVLAGMEGAKEQAEQKKAIEFSHAVRVSLGADLIGEWRLNDGAGNSAVDSSGYGNDGDWSGTGVGGTHWTTDGMYDGAGLFNGTDDYVITPNMVSRFSDETVTIGVWFKASGAGVIVSELGQASINSGWHDSQIEILSTGEVRVRVWGLSSVSLGIVDFEIWNYAVLRYDKKTQNFDGFLNGVESSGDVNGDRAAPWEAGYGLYYAFGSVDSTNLGSGAYFNGIIDELQIFNQSLSSAEIQQRYSQGADEHGIVFFPIKY